MQGGSMTNGTGALRAPEHVELPASDRRYEIGKSYEGVLARMQFNIQRRVNLAFGLGDPTLKGVGIWGTLFVASKTLTAYPKGAAIAEALFLWFPVFGMLLCIVYMLIGKSVYQDEVNYNGQGLDYEDKYTGSYGVANTRFLEIVTAKYLRPATTEIAGLCYFLLWLSIALISRYYTL